jgi:hypothetical protein
MLTARLEADTEEYWNASPPEAINSPNEAMREYEARRCRICGARYPAFGFGPPLTRTAQTVWACSAHRAEVDCMLSQGAAIPLQRAQLKLL